jgi:hypothetical protein
MILDSEKATELNVCTELKIFVQLIVVIGDISVDEVNFKWGLKIL